MKGKIYLKRKFKRILKTKHVHLPKWSLYTLGGFIGLVLVGSVVNWLFLPSISLKGNKYVVLDYKEQYVEKGYKALYMGNDITKKVIVSVLGNSNRGKTHILQKLSGELLKPGYQSTTRGLSIKLCGENIILLDTAGTNAPLLIENDDEIDVRSDKQKIDEIHSCKIITNHILQSFVINQAHILICVVGMLTKSEQNFLTKINQLNILQ